MALVFDNQDNLRTLYELFKYESKSVAGPHGGRPLFKPWSVEEVVDSDADIGQESLESLIEELKRKKQVMVIPGDPIRYATRTSEVVRTIGTMHEYVKRETDDDDDSEDSGEKTHLQLIEAVKWIPAVMDRPERDVPVQTFLDELRVQIEVSEPRNFPNHVTVELAVLAVEIVISAIAKVVAGERNKFKLTKFQLRAINDALMTSWTGENRPVIVSAGTGSGKTIAFTVPVLVDALLNNYSRYRSSQHGQWSQLLTYPRNDLAFDQFSTLTTYIEEINRGIRKDAESPFKDAYITIAIDAGGMIKKYNKDIPGIPIAWDLKKEWMGPNKNNVVRASISRYGGRDPENRNSEIRSSSIIIAGLESFRRRMVIPEVVNAAKTSLKRVVFDEIHLASGLEGGHIRGLFNRLNSIVKSNNRKLDFIGASATIAEPQNHVSKVWGANPDNVHLVEPSEEESKGSMGGIVNHILVRPRTGVTKGGPVYNTTSLMGHQTQDLSQLPPPLENKKIDSSDIEKMICFADSKEFVGRWQMILNENEGTMNAQSISESQVKDGSGGAITLPYAHWFDRPMAQILGDSEMCRKCKGERQENGDIATPCKMNPPPPPIPRERIFSFRTKIGGISAAERFAMEVLPKDGEEFIQVNGLDECPMLQAGVCWWFSGDSDSEPILEKHVQKDNWDSSTLSKKLVKRPNTGDDENFVFARTLRSRRHTADQSAAKEKDGLSTKDDQFSSNKLFQHASGEAYPPVPQAPPATKHIPHNVIIATPTLEVGVDMDNVSNVVMHRAMRDISSYRQKAGRAGREKNSVVNVTTILSKRAQDYEFYNNHGQLILQPIRNVVPIASQNRTVMLSQCYMSVMDFVASKDINIEELSSPDWANQLEKAIELLEMQGTRRECSYWISSGFWGVNTATISSDDISKVIQMYLKHLRLINDSEFVTKGEISIRIKDAITLMHQKKFPVFPEVDKGSDEKIKRLLPSLSKLVNQNPDLNEDLKDEVSKFCEESPTMNTLESIHVMLTTAKSELSLMSGMKISEMISIVEEIATLLSESKLKEPVGEFEVASSIKTACNDRSATFYLSYLLSKASCFLEDAPFCFVSSILENPKERKVSVRKPGPSGGVVTQQTVSQIMRDLLPGTWNFRLASSGTGHSLKSPIGGNGIDRDGDYDYVILNSGELDVSESFDLGVPQRVIKINQQAKMNKVPWFLRSGFSSTDEPEIIQPSFVPLKLEPGMPTPSDKNVPSKVGYIQGTGLVYKMDRPEHGNDYSLIPESWPMRWSLYHTKEEVEDILSYTPSSKTNPGNGLRDVTLHPSIDGTFSQVKFAKFGNIKNVVTGVTRSRGVLLRYHTKIDGKTKDVVYGDSFETEGIEYKLENELVTEINSDVEDILSWKFDSDMIKLLHHHMERMQVLGPKDSLTLRSIIQILLIKLYSDNEQLFPDTMEELIHVLKDYRIEKEDVNVYLSTVRKNIEALYKENLEKCCPLFNQQVSKIWEVDSIKESAKEWLGLTLLNTLGRGLVGSVSKFSGVQEEKISSTIDLQNWSVFVYDNEPGGNGTSESIKEHYQITEAALNAQRQMNAPPPPENDFIHHYERWLKSCKEHINHRVALSHVNGTIEDLPRNMNSFVKESQHLADRFKEYWNELDITSLRRAGILGYITPHLVQKLRSNNVEIESVDTLDQALSLCDTGCFSCQGSYAGSSFPGMLSERFTSRNVLEKYAGISINRKGYGTQFDARKSRGLVTHGVREEFPHWKRNENQIFTFHETCVPEHVSWHHLERSSDGDLPKTSQLKRLFDSNFKGGDE